MNTEVEIGQVALENCYRTLITKGGLIFVSARIQSGDGEDSKLNRVNLIQRIIK